MLWFGVWSESCWRRYLQNIQQRLDGKDTINYTPFLCFARFVLNWRGWNGMEYIIKSAIKMWNRLLPEFRWCVPVMISWLIGGDGKAPLWKLCSIKRQTVKWCSAPCLEICVPTRSYSLRNIFEIFEKCVPTCSLSLRKIFVNIWYMCANVKVLFRSRKIFIQLFFFHQRARFSFSIRKICSLIWKHLIKKGDEGRYSISWVQQTQTGKVEHHQILFLSIRGRGGCTTNH